MHYEGVPVSSYYVIAEFASVRIIFGATVYELSIGAVMLHFISYFGNIDQYAFYQDALLELPGVFNVFNKIQ